MTTTTHFKPQHQPTPEQIAKRAYGIYISEGSPSGRAVLHWLRAERELQSLADRPVITHPKSRAKPHSRMAMAAH